MTYEQRDKALDDYRKITEKQIEFDDMRDLPDPPSLFEQELQSVVRILPSSERGTRHTSMAHGH